MTKLRIVLIGMKSCGKSTVGKLLAKTLNYPFLELDNLLEKEHQRIKKEKLIFREIHKNYGADYFRELETKVLKKALGTKSKKFVLICGGGTPIKKENQKLLKKSNSTIIYLEVRNDILLKRILKGGIPAFFPCPAKPKYSLEILMKERNPIYKKIANIKLSVSNLSPKKTVEKIISKISKDEKY